MENESNVNKEFEELYGQYRQKLYRYAYKYLRNSEDAEDVVQEAFLRFFMVCECEQIASPERWLARVTRYRMLNLIRDRKQNISLQEQPFILDQVEICPDVMDEFFEKMMRKDIWTYAADIMRALKAHNPGWYEVVLEVYCVGVPGNDAAAALGITRNALDCRLTRAKEWIRKNYKEEYDRITEGK